MNDDYIKDELDEEDEAGLPHKKPLLDDDLLDPLDSINPGDIEEEAVGELGGRDGEEAEEDEY